MRAHESLRLATLVLVGAALGCAATPHDAHETPAPPPSALDAPPDAAPSPAEAVEIPLADEAGLAEFERLLADKETRLRAAGVLLARRDDAKDNRYAPPPPEPAAAEEEKVARDRKSKGDIGGGGGRSSTASTTATQPRPASTPTARTPGPERAKAGGARAETSPRKPASRPADLDEAEPGGRCQTICDLADATCDLEGKICDLAARHPNDARYVDLCRRADEDCRVAAEACQLCSP